MTDPIDHAEAVSLSALSEFYVECGDLPQLSPRKFAAFLGESQLSFKIEKVAPVR